VILPERVRAVVRQATGAEVTSVRRVSGGSINEAAAIGAGRQMVFAKWHAGAPPGFFEAEVDGLERLGAAGLRVPEVIAVDEAASPSVLVLSYVETSPSNAVGSRSAMADAGRALATLHASRGFEPGLERDNFIGLVPQSNGVQPNESQGRQGSWVEFFRTHRVGALASVLSPQQRTQLGRLDLEQLLTEPVDGCALLHGDLWGGNLLADPAGAAWFVDPAVYWGHPEVDLAMTRLFGGFDPSFYGAYQNIAGRFDTGLDARLEVLNLYPLLVHAHLFGGSYVGQVASIIQRYGG
jgi:protein-ribulosamine 3-kinase